MFRVSSLWSLIVHIVVSVAHSVFWANWVDTSMEVYKWLNVEAHYSLNSCMVYILATNGSVN